MIRLVTFCVISLIIAGVILAFTWDSLTPRRTVEFHTRAAYLEVEPFRSSYIDALDRLRRARQRGASEAEEKSALDHTRAAWERFADKHFETTVARGEVLLLRVEDIERRIQQTENDREKGLLASQAKVARNDFDSLEVRLKEIKSLQELIAPEVQGLSYRPEVEGERALFREVVKRRSK